MLRWMVIASLALSVSASFECGTVPLDNPLESRVVGGHIPGAGNFPFVAYVQHANDNGPYCSGSIVGPRHVLTGAHCVDDPFGPMPETINASDFRVRTGSLWKRGGPPRMVKTVFTGPQWAKTNGIDRKVDDIAILELEEPIDFDDYAQPICLPKSFRERPGDPGYFVGWGRRNTVPEPDEPMDYERPAVANENIVPFRKWSHCSLTNASLAYLHREDFICVGQYMRHVHLGDSGGPLMVNRKGIWFQVGTYSAGSERDGRGQGKFSRVTSYCKWFDNVTNGEVKCVKH